MDHGCQLRYHANPDADPNTDTDANTDADADTDTDPIELRRLG